MKYIKEQIGSLVKTSKFYWLYRHIFEKNIWNEYADNANSQRCKFYNKIYYKYRMSSVFEFGCASGPNLISIKKEFEDLVALGFDINKRAITTGKNFLITKNSKNKIKLTSKLNLDIFNKFRNDNHIDQFDMAIYDRVLYLIDDSALHSHMQTYSSFFSKIVIDDFCSNNNYDSKHRYRPRNFKHIMKSYNFNLIKDDESEHAKANFGEDILARRLIFSKSRST